MHTASHPCVSVYLWSAAAGSNSGVCVCVCAPVQRAGNTPTCTSQRRRLTCVGVHALRTHSAAGEVKTSWGTQGQRDAWNLHSCGITPNATLTTVGRQHIIVRVIQM
jgi:hypothetical protein